MKKNKKDNFQEWALKEINTNYLKGQVYGENCTCCKTKIFPKELQISCCAKCKNKNKK